MRGVFTKRTVLWLAIISAVSLVALAVLQYRWITELGASERALLDVAIERGLRNFRDEINTEVNLLVDRTMTGRERSTEDFGSRFHNASSSVTHPKMVRAVYLLEGNTVMQHVPTGPLAGVTVVCPDYLKELQGELVDPEREGPPPRPFWDEAHSAVGLPGQPGRRDDRPEDEPPPPPPGQDRDGPPGTEGPPPRHRPPLPPVWVVFEFDAEYVRKVWVPELVNKHLGQDYAVEVASVNGPERKLASPDSSTAFLSIQLKGPERRQEPPHLRPRQAPEFESPRFVLSVRHKRGSLDEQVAAVRRRNLGITLAVLLILALSSSALVVALNRADYLNRVQMDFVAGVSHELRTPLAVIRSAGENLADGVVASEKQVRKYGALVRDEGTRLSTMVEQILRFAGVESGRAPYNFAAVAPGQIVERALGDMSETLMGIEIEKRIESGLPAVLADEASLSHCLQNLVGNAVKYGDGKWLEVSVLRKGSTVEFAVTDRGPGVDPADMASLFDPFYRGKKAVSEQVHGLGIGLSLVKRVAEAHGGRVDVMNLPGGGARFSVFIPVESKS